MLLLLIVVMVLALVVMTALVIAVLITPLLLPTLLVYIGALMRFDPDSGLVVTPTLEVLTSVDTPTLTAPFITVTRATVIVVWKPLIPVSPRSDTYENSSGRAIAHEVLRSVIALGRTCIGIIIVVAPDTGRGSVTIYRHNRIGCLPGINGLPDLNVDADRNLSVGWRGKKTNSQNEKCENG
jgi:hypothetical protein